MFNFSEAGTRIPSNNNIVTDSLFCYNDSERRIKSMSSLIVNYTKNRCIIASDSRNTRLPKKDVYDNYPKLFNLGDVVIGVVGVNNYYNKDNGSDMEIGEFVMSLSDKNYESELLYFSSKIMKSLPDERNTIFAIIERNNPIVFKEIAITNNGVKFATHNGSPTTIAYGVRHCLASLEFSTTPKSELEPMKNLIEIDRKADEVVNKPGTVGGPIQAYLITPDIIKDLSDDDAPKNFDRYYAELKSADER